MAISPSADTHPKVFRVQRGCKAAEAGGCGCLGICRELVEVVLATEYFRVLGALEEARRTQ